MEAAGAGQGVHVFACPQSEDGEQFSENAASIGEPPGYGLTFEVEGLGYIAHAKHYGYLAPVAILAAASYESFSDAFRDHDVEAVYITSDSADDFDPEESQMDDGFRFEFRDTGAVVVVDTRFRRESDVPERLQELARGIAHRAGVVVVSVVPDVEFADSVYSRDWSHDGDKPSAFDSIRGQIVENMRSAPRTYRVELGPGEHTSTLAPLIEASRNLVALTQVMRGQGRIDVHAVRTWLRAGRFDLLLGLAESSWFEIKEQAYNVASPAPPNVRLRQGIELAQDVARFANSDQDAVLILGYREHGSVASSLTPIPLEQLDADRYRAILDQHVFPPIDGLQIDVFETEPELGVMMISVPPQARALQPYLVHGVVVGDKVEGAFFSIVRRRGEASIPTVASQVHGYIVAGRNGLGGNSPAQAEPS